MLPCCVSCAQFVTLCVQTATIKIEVFADLRSLDHLLLMAERAADNVPSDDEEETTVSIVLRDVLVLRVEHGRDHFVTVSANFCPTPAGNESSRVVN